MSNKLHAHHKSILAGYASKRCGHPKDPIYGSCKVSNTAYGPIATYYCNDGYRLHGRHSLRRCLSNGHWSGKAPVCRKIGKPRNFRLCVSNFISTMDFILADYIQKGCGHPKDPIHGYCKVTGTGYGSTVSYYCDDGYQLHGGYRVRKCLSNGYWGGRAPLCRKIGKFT